MELKLSTAGLGFFMRSIKTKTIALLIVIICSSITIDIVHSELSTGSCEPCVVCPDPLVALKDASIGGNIPGSSEFAGWDQDSLSGREANPLGQYLRGIDFLYAREDHLCADLYYLVELVWSPSASVEHVRAGTAFGEAKYTIETEIEMFENTSGEQTVVNQWTEQRTLLEEPIIRTSPSGIEHPGYYDWQLLDESPALVPLLGRIHVKHKLVALKNGETYDEGQSSIDWVRDPPSEMPDNPAPGQSWTENSYFAAAGVTLEQGGQTYTGSDGLITGDFAPASLQAMRFHFEHGDVGVTIRKKESPTDASVRVDDAEFPPEYKLRVSNILNHFDEPLPNEVLVALKAEKGRLMSGRPLGDWLLFRTWGGQIVDEVRYHPPDCVEAKEDKLLIAGVCDFHDGPRRVCDQPIIEKIINNQCYDLTAQLVRHLTRRGNMYEEASSDSKAFVEGYYQASLQENILAVMTLGLEQERVWVSQGLIKERYRCKTLDFSLSHVLREDVKDYYELDWRATLITHKRAAQASKPQLTSSCDQMTLSLLLDEQTKEVKSVSWSPPVARYRFNMRHAFRRLISDLPDEERFETKEEERFISFASDKALREAATQTPLPLSGFLVRSGGNRSFGGHSEETKQVRHSAVTEGLEQRDRFTWDMTRQRIKADRKP